MPVTKTSPDPNFSFRPRPKSWVDSPITVTDAGGTVYQLAVLSDAEGRPVSAVSDSNLFDAITETNECLRDIVQLLQEMVSG